MNQKPRSPSFVPIVWRESLFLWLVDMARNLLLLFSPLAWIAHLRKAPNPMWAVDLWVLLQMVAVYWFLLAFSPESAYWRTAAPLLAAFLLIDSAGVLLRDIASPLKHDAEGAFVYIREPRRWLLMTPVTIAIMVGTFAVLYLRYRSHFDPCIADAWSAFYYSIVTFTTLGYGDYKPITTQGRLLVSAELGFVIIVLSLKLPLALSAIRVKPPNTHPRNGA